MAACAMLLRQADTPSPKKGAFYKREAGLGAAQGQSLVRAAQSPGFHPKLHRKRGGGKRKPVIMKAAILLQMHGWPWVKPTADNTTENPPIFSYLFENFQFLHSIGCYDLYK